MVATKNVLCHTTHTSYYIYIFTINTNITKVILVFIEEKFKNLHFLWFFMIKSSSLEDKWGEKSLVFGWTGLPISLLLNQKKLGLTPLGLNVLLHLVSQWWHKEQHPYPSQASIAEKVGVSTRTVQREITQMKKKGLLRIKRTLVHDEKYLGRNVYDLSPLAEKLQKLSEELLTEQDMKKKRLKTDELANALLHDNRHA